MKNPERIGTLPFSPFTKLRHGLIRETANSLGNRLVNEVNRIRRGNPLGRWEAAHTRQTLFFRVVFLLLFVSVELLVSPCSGAPFTFSPTSSLATGRLSHSATLLANGNVLVAGGDSVVNSAGVPLATTELFNPALKTWRAAGALSAARAYHTATLLSNGQVLATGGNNINGILASAELYDPIAGTWTVTGGLSFARNFHTATLLPSGQVLVAGGNNGGSIASTELYDPVAGGWTITSDLSIARQHHTATLLSNGQVLVAGGCDSNYSPLASAELYNPATGAWTATGNLTTARIGHTATLLPNGQVLVAGGYSASNFIATGELYNPTTGTWTTVASLNIARGLHTATLLSDGNVLVAGGYGSSGYLSSAELFNPNSQLWIATGSLATAREFHTATLLPNGIVLVAGGYNGTGIASTEVYNENPNATTGTAIVTSYQSATITGSVNPNGLETTVFFQYGTTATYGITTGTQDAGSGAAVVSCTATIAGLSASTTFHYRIVAINISGTTSGADCIFTTPNNPPPTVTSGTATEMSYESAVLNGTVNSNGLESTSFFQYGLSTNYDFATAPQDSGSGTITVPCFAAITGLVPTATYHFRIVGISSTGTTCGSDKTFTANPPPAVTTDAVTGILFNGATLNGTVNPDGLPTTVYFRYGITIAYGSTTALMPVGNSAVVAPVSATIAGLKALTTYHYQIVGSSSNGTTYGYDQTFTTLPPPPPTVATGTATTITYSNVIITGTVNPNGLSTTLFFQYGTNTTYGNTTATQNAGSGTIDAIFSAKVTGLNPVTSYHFRLVAANTSGTSFGNDQQLTTASGPPAVTTGTAAVLSYQAAVLSGTATSNGLPTTIWFQYGTTAYSLASGSLALESGTSAVPFSQTITGLNGATLYHYRSVATNSLGTVYGLDKTFRTFNPPPVVTTGPVVGTTAASTTLNGTVNPSGLATVAWFESGTDTTYGTSSPQVPLPAILTAITQTAFLANLSSFKVYHYRLVAANVSGTSWGNDASLTTSGAPVVSTGDVFLTSANGTTLSGIVNPCLVPTTYYFVYGLPTASGTQTTRVSAGSGGTGISVSAAITGLTPNTTYSYHLVASNTNGTVSSLPQLFTTANMAPAVITGAATVLSYQAVTLTGTAIPYGLPTNVGFQYGPTTTYGLTTGSDTQVFASGTSATAFSAVSVSDGLKGATLYHYRSVATNSLGTTYGKDMTFTTNNPPPVVTTGGVSNTTLTSATLLGTVNPSGLGTTTWFEFWTDTTNVTPTPQKSPITGVSVTNQTAPLTNLSPGTLYHYHIVAFNTSGTSTGNDASFTTSGAPIVTTGTASRITGTTVLLSGTVNPSGLATTYYFEYGFPNNLVTLVPPGRPSFSGSGTQTARVSAGSGINGIAASVTIGALSPNTNYAYHLVASNTNGTTYGYDQFFTTANSAPAVITGTAIVLSYQSVTLTGTATPNGLPTNVSFQYGPTGTYGFTTGSDTQFSGNGTSAFPFSSGTAIAGLKGATIYHYRAVATNSLGTTYGKDMTFTTNNPPPVVTTGGATGITATSGTVNGTVNPSGLQTTAWFESGTDTSYGTTTPQQTLISVVALASPRASLSSLTPGTLYHYRIVASNTSGTSCGNDATFTPAGQPIVTTGSASLITASGATLSGTINPCWAPTTYYFEYSQPSKSGTTSKLSLASGGVGIAVSAPIIGLSATTTTTTYRLVAINSSGATYGSYQTFTTAGAPMAVTGGAVSTPQGILVSGYACADGLPTTVYFKYGKTSAYGSTTAIQSAKGTDWSSFSATIAGLVSGTTYHYQIVAANSSLMVTGSDQTFVTPTSAPTTPILTVTSTGETVATLQASLSPQNGATNVSFQYGVTAAYGKTSGTIPLAAIGLTSTASTGIFALAPNTTYHVRCVAQNGQGTTYSTPDVTFKTLPRFDVNRDGFSELPVVDTATGNTTLLSIGNATATSGTLMVTSTTAGPTIPLDATFCQEAEFNRNGTKGWVVSGSTATETELLTSDSNGNWTSTPLVTGTFIIPDGSDVVGVGDFNGDGNPDLVLTGSDQKVTFLLLNGFNVIGKLAGPTLPAGFGVAAVDDLNGDQKPDLLIWQPATGQTDILALNGASLGATTAGPVIPLGWQLVGTDALTGTGTPNWLLFNQVTGATQIWRMQSAARLSILFGPTIPTGSILLGNFASEYPVIGVLSPIAYPMNQGDTLDLGQVVLGVGSPRVFTISNNGTATLGAIAVSITGSNAHDFVVSAPASATVLSGSNTTFRVKITASALGVRNATLRITSNDPFTPSFVLQLTCTGINFADQAGTFTGMSDDGSGFASLSLNSNGGILGRAIISGTTYTLNCSLDGYGEFYGTIGTPPVPVSIILDPSGGSLMIQIADSSFGAYLPAYTGGTFVAEAGKYTVLLDPATSDLTLPQGTGYATLTVSNTGSVILTGTLADGTGFSTSGPLVSNPYGNQFVFCDTTVYPNGGLLVGSVTFESLQNSDCDAFLCWIKPQQSTGSYYKAGFNTRLDMIGARYSAPAPGAMALSFATGSNNGMIQLSNGGLVDSLLQPKLINETVTLSSSNVVTVSSSSATENLKLTINTSNGTFTGSFLNPVNRNMTTFNGVLYQNGLTPQAGGFFLGPIVNGAGLSGDVLLSPSMSIPY